VDAEGARLRAFAVENRRRLVLVLVAGGIIAAIELAAGLTARALVLVGDATHYFADLLSLGLALAAVTWGMRPADSVHSFGHRRGEVLAAAGNAVLLWGLVAYLAALAIGLIRAPVPVSGAIVVVVGAGTLAANLVLARALGGGAAGNLNVRAAYLHIVSDALGSLAAVAAGLGVFLFRFNLADPIAALVVTGLIAVFAARLTRDVVHTLMDSTPRHIDPHAVEQCLRSVGGVRSVHDLHIWSLGPGVEALSAHVVLGATPTDDRVTHTIQEAVGRLFRIGHVTIQVEAPDCPCAGQPH